MSSKSLKALILILLFLVLISVVTACGSRFDVSIPLTSTASQTLQTPLPSTVVVTEEAGDGYKTPISPTPTLSLAEVETAATASISKPVFGSTNLRADGNRWISGQGTLPNAPPLDIPLLGEPAWIVAAPTEAGSIWAVVLTTGKVQAFQVTEGMAEEIPITPERLPPGMPPYLKVEDNTPTLITAPLASASTQTHPVILSPTTSQLAFIDANGDVVIWNEAETARLSVNALPDARLLVDEKQRILLLTNPTNRYDHGVLGDKIEAAAITLIETIPTPRVALTIPISEPTVIEGIAPIWADFTDDDTREIVVTLSNKTQGAQIVAFNEAGDLIAAGPAIGQGYRWRNQLGVAPFGPNNQLTLVDVLTPHINGVVEFYHLQGDSLQIVAQTAGFTSHVIDTRNLDMALAGDFDGDGQLEVLLPNQRRDELGAIRYSADGAEIAWAVPAGGSITTNISAVSLADDQLIVGLGRADGVLRLWGP